MLKSFERRLIGKFDDLKKASIGTDCVVDGSTEDKQVYSTPGSGCWSHWGEQYRREPHKYECSNKMTLQSPWLRYFCPNQANNIHYMKYFSAKDLKNIRTERLNLSAYKILIQFILSEAKREKSLH